MFQQFAGAIKLKDLAISLAILSIRIKVARLLPNPTSFPFNLEPFFTRLDKSTNC